MPESNPKRKRNGRKLVWTEAMLEIMRSALHDRRPTTWVAKQIQELDPTLNYQAVRTRYLKMMAAGLLPAWTHTTKRLDRSH